MIDEETRIDGTAEAQPVFTNRVKWFAGLLALFLVGMANLMSPVITTSSAFVNHVLEIGIFSLPSVLLILALGMTKKLLPRAVMIIVAIPVLFFAVFLFWGSLFFLLLGVTEGAAPTSHERVQTIKFEDTYVNAYRSGGGVFAAEVVIVRHEKILIPGILLVREIYNASPSIEVKVIRIDQETVRIISPRYFRQNPRSTPPNEKTVKLEPWIYF